MAASFGEGGDEPAEIHEINVTPFIDVMLVLLIIFMVAAPLATADVDVDLPRTNTVASPRPEKPLFLTLRPDQTLTLGPDEVSRKGLAAALDRATEGDRDGRIFLRADRSLDYGSVMEVMNLVRSAGYLKIALVGLEAASPSTP